MLEERLFAIAVAALFGFLPFAVKDMPPIIAGAGVIGGLLIGLLSFAPLTIVPLNPKFVWPIAFIITGLLCCSAGGAWLFQRISEAAPPVPSTGANRVRIVLGTGAPYETVTPAGVNRRRTIRVKIENNTDAEISNTKLRVLNLDPPYRGNTEWLLRDGITIGPHGHTFVEIAAYDEGTSQAPPGPWIRLIVPMEGGFFAEAYPNLPVQSHTFHLGFSVLENGLSDEVYCRLFVDSDHVLHLENWAT